MQIVSSLQGNSSSLSAFRATCSHWRTCADATMQMLSPKALLPKDLIRLFPTLHVSKSMFVCVLCAGMWSWPLAWLLHFSE